PGVPQARGRSAHTGHTGGVRLDQVPTRRPGVGAHAGGQGAHWQAVQRRPGPRRTEVRGPMTPRSSDDAGAVPLPATRFGARLGGIGVALPAGTALEFVADAAIYPLPLAPARVAGLMQLRGQPLVVLDPSTEP